MSIEPFVVRRMNPFTRKEFEIPVLADACPPETGDYIRLVAGPREAALATTDGCRVGGPSPAREGQRFVAQLDLAALARVQPGAMGGLRSGFLAMYVDADFTEPPFLEYSATPVAGPPAPGRRLLPELAPIDPKREDEFERHEGWLLAHRVGWARGFQGLPTWLDCAIDLELARAGVPRSLEGLRAAEASGVDVVGIVRGATKWRLLWQLATDDDLDLDWGDGSRLFVLVREEDLAARRFDRVVFEVIPFS